MSEAASALRIGLHESMNAIHAQIETSRAEAERLHAEVIRLEHEATTISSLIYLLDRVHPPEQSSQ